MKAQIVVFRRKGSAKPAVIESYVRRLLEGDLPLEPLSPHRVLNWMTFCRRIGWYFEATVLYERALHDREQLSENETDEVERIYAACRRASSSPRPELPCP